MNILNIKNATKWMLFAALGLSSEIALAAGSCNGVSNPAQAPFTVSNQPSCKKAYKAIDLTNNYNPTYVEVTLTNAGANAFGSPTVTGEWVATNVHDFWDDYSNNFTFPPVNYQNLSTVTQMIFSVEDAAVTPSDDTSFQMIKSGWISDIKVIAWPSGTQNYKDFMQAKKMCISPSVVDGPYYVTHGNYSTYSHVQEGSEGWFGWDVRVSQGIDSNGHAIIGKQSNGTDIVFTTDVAPEDWPGAKEDYYAFGKTIKLPMPGHFGDGNQAITYVTNSTEQDFEPGNAQQSQAGNYHLAQIYGKYQFWSVHQKQNSMPSNAATVGGLLNFGDSLGQMGNSGFAESPQLHMSMIWRDEDTTWGQVTGKSWSIPVEFCETNSPNYLYTLQGGGQTTSVTKSVPKACSWVSDSDFCDDSTGSSCSAQLTNADCSGASNPPPPTPSSQTWSNVNISKKKWKRVTFDIPSGASQLKVTTTGGSGDGDLYVRHNNAPTTNSYDCASTASANTETCTINNPSAGTWHIGVKAWSSVSGITINAVRN